MTLVIPMKFQLVLSYWYYCKDTVGSLIAQRCTALQRCGQEMVDNVHKWESKGTVTLNDSGYSYQVPPRSQLSLSWNRFLSDRLLLCHKPNNCTLQVSTNLILLLHKHRRLADCFPGES